MQVMDMNFVFDDIEPEIVSSTDYLSTLDPATGHPHAESRRVVIATGLYCGFAVLDHRGPTKFSSPNNQRSIQEAQSFQVFQQSSGRLIITSTVFLQLLV